MLKASSRLVKVASAQIAPKLFEKDKNLEKSLKFIEKAAKNGAKLIVFPECSLTGYFFKSLDEAKNVSETVPGTSTQKIATKCSELGVYVILGLIERDDNKYYNTAVFISPEGIIGKHRKTHLPQMGFDRFAERGDEAPQVFQTEVGRVGILICYEQVFPELARILTLKGAEIIVAIQNILVDRHECIAAFLAPCRAYENRVFLILSSRVGLERGNNFLGQSLIVNFTGDKIIQASDNHEEIIYATFDISKLLADERKKDWFADRRPELFGAIS